MPVYEYECQKCGERFELRRSMSDSDGDIKCPRCEAEDTRRIFSTFGMTSTGSSCASGGST